MSGHAIHTHSHRHLSTATIVVLIVLLILVAVAVLELAAGHAPVTAPLLVPHVSPGPMG